jgi:hypothetical protein
MDFTQYISGISIFVVINIILEAFASGFKYRECPFIFNKVILTKNNYISTAIGSILGGMICVPPFIFAMNNIELRTYN